MKIKMKLLLIIICCALSSTSYANSAKFSVNQKFLDKIGNDYTIYHVYCVVNNIKNFCSIETLYINKLESDVCEMNPTSWTSSSKFFEVNFNPSNKSFTILTTLDSPVKKMMYVISKEKFIQYGEDGKTIFTTMPKEKNILLNCKDVSFKTHLERL